MKIISIQVGKPKTYDYNNKKVSTGIFKTPVVGPVMLRHTNFDGDEQADLDNHGGRDKALYAYSCDVYPHWEILRPQDKFSYGAMGENLSFDELPENSIYIGDIYQLGGSKIQVAQPRFPCYKLGLKFNDPSILKQFMQLGHPGVYFRVIKEGLVNVGDELILAKKEPIRLSINELFTLRQNGAEKDRIKEILQIASLPDNWKAELQEKL